MNSLSSGYESVCVCVCVAVDESCVVVKYEKKMRKRNVYMYV